MSFPTHAMVLAAGLGRRMGTWTDRLPKPLLPVGGCPMLGHQLERLVRAGVTHVVVNVHHHADQVLSALPNLTPEGLTVRVSEETTLLDTAGALVRARPWLGDDPFFLVSSDVLGAWDLQTLCPMPSGSLGHLLMVDNPDDHAQGDMHLDAAGRLWPRTQQASTTVTFGGVALIRPELLDGWDDGPRPLGDVLKRAWAHQHTLTGVHYQGPWFNVGTPERWAAAERWWVAQSVAGIDTSGGSLA